MPNHKQDGRDYTDFSLKAVSPEHNYVPGLHWTLNKYIQTK